MGCIKVWHKGLHFKAGAKGFTKRLWPYTWGVHPAIQNPIANWMASWKQRTETSNLHHQTLRPIPGTAQQLSSVTKLSSSGQQLSSTAQPSSSIQQLSSAAQLRSSAQQLSSAAQLSSSGEEGRGGGGCLPDRGCLNAWAFWPRWAPGLHMCILGLVKHIRV